jgi:hypothetical protein
MEYTYNKDNQYKILNLPIKRINDNIKRNMAAMVNSYRSKKRLENFDQDLKEQKVYIASLENKPYSQVDLFD